MMPVGLHRRLEPGVAGRAEVIALAAGSVIAVIPARYASSRLPGKPLRGDWRSPDGGAGWRSVARASGIARVIVATDDERIAEVVTQAGGEAMMTSDRHPSGTDRVAEVATPGARRAST